MKQLIIQTGLIDKLSHDGKGIAHWQDKVVFVEGGLPGEQVQWQIIQRRSNFDEARTTQILVPSSDRTIPCCPHYEQCGGCLLQHLLPKKQLQFKQDVLNELFEHQLGISQLPWVAPITSSSTNYRRRARIGVKYLRKKERLVIGFHERRGRYLADINSCIVLRDNIGQRIDELRQLLSALTVFDQIAQLEITVDDYASHVVIRALAAITSKDRELLIDFSKRTGVWLYLQQGGLSSIQPLLNNQPLPSYHLPDFNLQLQFSPASFIQINGAVNRQLVNRVVQWLDPKPEDKIIDLYCGIGNFTLPLARSGAQLLGIEGEKTAVNQANANAILNGITNVEFLALDLSAPEQLNALSAKLASANKLLLDPPRTGAWEVISLLATLTTAPQQIVYVSCNPATLVRDCTAVVTAGYNIVSIGVADMYPHTAHIETIVLLSR